MKEVSEKPQLGDILQDTWSGLLETVKVIKNKDSLRNFHSQEELKEIKLPKAMLIS